MKPRVLILGVGSFAHSMMKILSDQGAECACYLTRDYGHFGPMLLGQTWQYSQFPNVLEVVDKFKADLIIPMSIDWHTKPWGAELVRRGAPLLSPIKDALKIESERDFARQLCQRFGIPFPQAHVVKNRLEALQLMESDPRPYVLKNPLCSPFSPIHTIVCETVADTLGWLDRVDYAEGVFMQEYLGPREAGHFVFVSQGEIQSLVTNQEYKRAFTGNMGPVAGAPLGGIVQQDSHDQYGLAKQLIHPLRPWLLETGYHGPLQVTAIQREGIWYPIEYNVRLGVTSGAMFLRMLHNGVEALQNVAKNQMVTLQWREEIQYGCSLTLAGYGYPYVVPHVPQLPVIIEDSLDCDLWWNEVDWYESALYMTQHKGNLMGHRIADLVALAADLPTALQSVYANIKKIRCLSSYYRLDIGQSLWPPGQGF